MIPFLHLLQIIVALGLLNVWLLRFRKPTAYRGGSAQTMREEFATYGLPQWSCTFVGVLKVGAAVLLIAGLFYTPIVGPAAALVAVLMVGALYMHMKISDPWKKSVPAVFMLTACVTLCGFSYAG